MTELTNDKIVDEFLNHIRYFKVAHHVTGRIRIKASLRSARELQHVNKEQLEEIIDRVPGVTSYRVNIKALSLVIEYDPEIVSFSLWEDAASIESYPLKREEVREKLLELLA